VLPRIGDGVARQKAERALTHLVKSDPMVNMRWATLAGDPAEKIAWLAREASADLIILAASGKSGLPALLSRSVTRDVERRARCPVVRLEVPEAWLSDQEKDWDRCVYCDAPTAGSVGGARFNNRNRIASHPTNGKPLELADVCPQI
jgi:hypothetical protein